MISPMRKVPPNIIRPDYAETGVPSSEQQKRADKRIEAKSAEDIQKMKVACLKARKVLDYAHSLVEPGVTTDYIDEQTHEFIINQDCYPSPLNYRGFPKSLCSSVNEVICHGIPDSRKLEEGDIVNMDITVYYDGFHGDCNETYCVGRVAESSKHLVKTTYDCLMKSIEVCKPGQLYRNIGNTIQQVADAAGLSVVKTFTGHGIGRLFHTAPSVPHYGNNNATGSMKAGHTFTIEPMINQGTWKDVIWEDDWTACTADGMRSAQFEHTLLIVPGGVEILTARLPESPQLEFMLE